MFYVQISFFTFNSRFVRHQFVKIGFFTTFLVVIIYVVTKTWKECKNRKKLAAVASLNINTMKHINNKAFNSTIIKSKVFIIYAFAILIGLFGLFFSIQFDLIEQYPKIHLMIFFFFYPLLIFFLLTCVYLKNPSLRKYVFGNLMLMFTNCLK